ncbi:MAG: hypothetical protein ACYCTB_09990 [bacterium]
MAIKKSKKEWAEEPIINKEIKESEPNIQLKIKTKRQEAKIPFAVRIPESLYNDLKNYLEKYGKAGESMNEIIMSGTETELQKRLSAAGENLNSKAIINNIISGIQGFLKELEGLK